MEKFILIFVFAIFPTLFSTDTTTEQTIGIGHNYLEQIIINNIGYNSTLNYNQSGLSKVCSILVGQGSSELYIKIIIYTGICTSIISLLLLIFIKNTNRKLIIHKERLEQKFVKQTESLIKAKTKAEEANKLKSSFLANMSHEIRTPMNGIFGFLDVIEQNHIDTETRLKYSNIVRNCTQQLLQLINDIVDVAKIESNSLSISYSEFDLNDVLYEIEESFNNMNKNKNLEIIFDTDGAVFPCIIYSDITRIQQIINNLIGNSLKFTEFGFIRFGYEIEDVVTIKFVVEDTGIGIPEDKMKYIFDRFNEIDPEGRIKYGGTGMGLYITHQIIELLGGNICVESTLGEGSIFTLKLPISKKSM